MASPAVVRAVTRQPALVPVALAVVVAWVVVAVTPMHAFWTMWVAMAAAMMLPSVVRPLARAAEGSPWRAAAFAAGFLAVWTLAGVPALLITHAVAWTPAWLATAWIVAGTWQIALRGRFSTCRSIAYRGRAGEYGVRQGLRCVATCGPLMIAVGVTVMAVPSLALALLLLVAVTALVCWEKSPRRSSRMVAAVGLAMVLVAGVVWVVAGNGPQAHGGHAMAGMSVQR